MGVLSKKNHKKKKKQKINCKKKNILKRMLGVWLSVEPWKGWGAGVRGENRHRLGRGESDVAKRHWTGDTAIMVPPVFKAKINACFSVSMAKPSQAAGQFKIVDYLVFICGCMPPRHHIPNRRVSLNWIQKL